mmetsp:Transcript_1334/g.4830  ORF Transcript_1334/g.4830 Transcript_1334/m.4830 type:complete len:257 (+) Transcript_1334:421-1191(+)
MCNAYGASSVGVQLSHCLSIAVLLYVKSIPYVSFVESSTFSIIKASPSCTMTFSVNFHAMRGSSAPLLDTAGVKPILQRSYAYDEALPSKIGTSPEPSSSMRQLSTPMASSVLNKCSAPRTTKSPSPLSSELNRTSSTTASTHARARASPATPVSGASIFACASARVAAARARVSAFASSSLLSAIRTRSSNASSASSSLYVTSEFISTLDASIVPFATRAKYRPSPAPAGRTRINSTSPLLNPTPAYVTLRLIVC